MELQKEQSCKFITASELSLILGIPKRTIYKLAREGFIPGTLRVGKHWRFQKVIIEDWTSAT